MPREARSGINFSGIIYEKRRLRFMQSSLFLRARLFLFGKIAAAGAVFAATAGYLNAVQAAIATVCVVSALIDVAFDIIIFHNLSVPSFIFSRGAAVFAPSRGIYPFIIPPLKKTIPYNC